MSQREHSFRMETARPHSPCDCRKHRASLSPSLTHQDEATCYEAADAAGGLAVEGKEGSSKGSREWWSLEGQHSRQLCGSGSSECQRWVLPSPQLLLLSPPLPELS